MNIFLNCIRTKAYQPINQHQNIYFKFPYSVDSSSGVISFPNNSLTHFSVIRKNDNPPSNLETPYFELVAESDSFIVSNSIQNNGEAIYNNTQLIATFQDKEDALFAQKKLMNALLRPSYSIMKKIVYAFLLVFFINVGLNLIVQHRNMTAIEESERTNQELKKYLNELGNKKIPTQSNISPSSVPANTSTNTSLANPSNQQNQLNEGQSPENIPATNLINSLKDKR